MIILYLLFFNLFIITANKVSFLRIKYKHFNYVCQETNFSRERLSIIVQKIVLILF